MPILRHNNPTQVSVKRCCNAMSLSNSFSLCKFSPLRTPDIRKKSQKSADGAESDVSMVTQDILQEAYAVRKKMKTKAISDDESDASRDLFITQSFDKGKAKKKAKTETVNLSDSFSSGESSSESGKNIFKPKSKQKSLKHAKPGTPSAASSNSSADDAKHANSKQASKSGPAARKRAISVSSDSDSSLLTSDSDSGSENESGEQKQTRKSPVSVSSVSESSSGSSDDEKGNSEAAVKIKQVGQVSADQYNAPIEYAKALQQQNEIAQSLTNGSKSDSDEDAKPTTVKQRQNHDMSDSEEDFNIKQKKSGKDLQKTTDKLSRKTSKDKNSGKIEDKTSKKIITNDGANNDRDCNVFTIETDVKSPRKRMSINSNVRDEVSDDDDAAGSVRHRQTSVSPKKSTSARVSFMPGKADRQLRYKFPPNFDVVNVREDFVSSAEADGKEPWLIRVPVDMDIQGLHGQKIKLSGAQNIHLCDESEKQYEVVSIPNTSDQPSDLCALVADGSRQTDNLVIGPCVAGQIHVMEWYPSMPPVSITRSPPVKHTIPDNLKQKIHPFGGDSPTRYTEDDENSRKKKKKKKHKHTDEDGLVEQNSELKERHGKKRKLADISTDDLDVSKAKKKKKHRNKE